MKTLKIISYVFSLIHLAVQFYFFTGWQTRISDLGRMATNLDPVTLINANLGLNQESFVFLSLAILTLAAYLTVSGHLNLLITEKAIMGDTGATAPGTEGE